jgi:hypothetical protein
VRFYRTEDLALTAARSPSTDPPPTGDDHSNKEGNV